MAEKIQARTDQSERKNPNSHTKGPLPLNQELASPSSSSILSTW